MVLKKFAAAALLAAMITITVSGCGYRDALDASETTAADETAEATADEITEAVSVSDSDYDDSLEGLTDYFTELGYIVEGSTVTDMDAALIGAEKGKKYAVSSSLTIELYEYDPDNLGDTANEVLESVKTDGQFTILGLSPVAAYISDSGKFLMIYSDSSIDSDDPDTTSDAYLQRENAINKFKAFHK